MALKITTDQEIVTPTNEAVRHLTLCIEPDESSPLMTNEVVNPVRYDWDDEKSAAKNYAALGELLAKSGDLYRRPEHGNGLMLVLPSGKHTLVRTGADLAPIIVDRVEVSVYLNGKSKGSKISAPHLNALLRSEVFLRRFLVVDQVTSVPMYLPDFRLTTPGYIDGGPDHRYLYTGEHARTSAALDHLKAFLDVMAFASEADRTNTVAAA